MNSNLKRVTGVAGRAAAVAFAWCAMGSAVAQNAPAFIPPGKVAPKMLTDANVAPKDRQWANAENFGTIPARLRAIAVKECGGMGSDYKPVGYHPDALDKDGKLIPGGGILCLTQETMDQITKAKK